MTVHAIKQESTAELKARYNSLAQKVKDINQSFGHKLAAQDDALSIYIRLNQTKTGFIDDFAFASNSSHDNTKKNNYYINKLQDLMSVTHSFTKASAETYIKADDIIKASILEAYKSEDEARIKEIEIMASKKNEASKPKAESTKEITDRLEGNFKSIAGSNIDLTKAALDRPLTAEELCSMFDMETVRSNPTPESEDRWLEMIAVSIISSSLIFRDLKNHYGVDASKLANSVEHILSHRSKNVKVDAKTYNSFTAEVKNLVDTLSTAMNEVSNTAPLNIVK